jgi:hypothetical protein
MKLKPQRNIEPTDLPSIRLNEGRWLLGLGRNKWREVWEEAYQFKVMHWMAPMGVGVNLDSLLIAVYPHIAKNASARALLAQEFMWKVVEQRQKEIEIRRDRKTADSRTSKRR